MTNQRRAIDVGTPSANDVAQKVLQDFAKEDLYLAIPAKVLGVQDYESSQCVDVQAVINDIYEDGIVLKAVRIDKVFVKLPAGGGVKIKLPISVDDQVTLHWAHRNLSDFISGDGSSKDVPLNLVADVRDCWVEHGFGTRSNNQNPSLTDLIIEHTNTVLTVKPDGNITLDTQADIEITTPAKVTVNCNLATINAPNTHLTGNLQVDGNAVVNGTLTSKSGTFSPTYAGYGGAGSMIIGDITSSGTVTIQGIIVNTHTHLYDGGSSTTDQMQ